MIRYPKKGVITPQRGLNLADNLFEVRPDEATSLRNMLFVRDSLLQRKPFRRYSTVDYAADGIFRGAHDYRYPGGNPRLLFATNGGKIKEYVSAASNSDRVTGLATGQEVHFATVYDAVVAVNGTSRPQIGRDTTWREMGSPAAVSTLAVSPSGAGAFTGSYLHVLVAAIETGGVGVVFSNWSNIVRSTPSADGQFDVTWTDIVDSRISAYYYFRTSANGQVLYSVARILPGVGAYTDTTADASIPVSVSQMPSVAPERNQWGIPPVSKYIVFSGNRAVFLGLSTAGNALQTSQVAASAYEAEGVPADGSTLVRMLKDGDLTAGYPVGDTGEGSPRANHLFVAQTNACYILPETNPERPLQIISPAIGCIGQRAIAGYDNWLFWQSQRGVEFWPGSGQTVYLISDKIQPVFAEGSANNQALTANQGDANITYEVVDDGLWITVRDDGTKTGGNKVYVLDLLNFKRRFDPINPANSSRFTGPLDNAGLGFANVLRRLDGTVLVFDNQNKEILEYDRDGTQDQIAGVDTDIPVKIKSGALMREDAIAQKVLRWAHVLQFTNSETTLKFLGEFDRVINTATVYPNTYALNWDDITWDDITWSLDTWFSETPLDYGSIASKWFVAELTKTDSEVDFAFFGFVFWAEAFQQIWTYR